MAFFQERQAAENSQEIPASLRRLAKKSGEKYTFCVMQCKDTRSDEGRRYFLLKNSGGEYFEYSSLGVADVKTVELLGLGARAGWWRSEDEMKRKLKADGDRYSVTFSEIGETGAIKPEKKEPERKQEEPSPMQPEDKPPILKTTPKKRDAAFANPDDEKIVIERVARDQRYSKFMERGKEIANRTWEGRQGESESFMAKYISPGRTVIIDIGSALGNSDPKQAGVTVYNLYQNPKIYGKAEIVATDIPSEYASWKKLKGRYYICSEEVPESFDTPISKIVKKYGDKPVVIIRSANGIDLIMNEEQTLAHMKHVIRETTGKDTYYFFNKHILRKAADEDSFKIIETMSESGFQHRSRTN